MKTTIEQLYEYSRIYFDKPPDKIVTLLGDGSDRKIFRIYYPDETFIGIYGANIRENRAFLSFTQQFVTHKLPTPEIYFRSPDDQFYIETDYGDVTLTDYYKLNKNGNSDNIRRMYSKILEYLSLFQLSGLQLDYGQCYQTQRFDFDSMMWDLCYFRDNFLSAFCTIEIDQNQLYKEFSQLSAVLASSYSRNYFMYRDFQSKNIMITDDKPFFIDYQSGRKGPLQYDVASLLFDANVDLAQDFRTEMIYQYFENADSKLHLNADHFLKYFYDFALLRILQALAAFSYLSFKKGKKQFLKSIPQALKNLQCIIQKGAIFQSMPELQHILYDDILSNDDLKAL